MKSLLWKGHLDNVSKERNNLTSFKDSVYLLLQIQKKPRINLFKISDEGQEEKVSLVGNRTINI